jgi:hypothetical protein
MSKGLLCRLWACLARHCGHGPEPADEPGFDGHYYGSKVSGLPYVVVKFRDDFEILYEDGQEGRLGKLWEEINRNRDLRLRPVYRGISGDKFRDLIRLARERDPGYKPPDLLKYFQITGPERTDWEAVAERLNRNEAGSPVEKAEVERPGPDPGLFDYSRDPLFAQQAYLQNAASPPGLRVRALWDADRAGSDGDGVYFVDVEQGWKLSHTDLPKPDIPLVTWPFPGGPTGLNYDPAAPHGTATLGILCMRPENGSGGIGVAPRAKGYVVSCVDLPASTPRPHPAPPVPVNNEAAIVAATQLLISLRAAAGAPPRGEVIVIERQVEVTDTAETPPRSKWGPVELIDANFWAIRTATALGITVVEAGGNGSGPDGGLFPPLNLDLWPGPALPKHFTPRNAVTNQVPKDSLAIIVSAANPGWYGPSQTAYGPVGWRIDCFGMGNWQVSTWTNAQASVDDYTATAPPPITNPPTPPKLFGYTSAATAMVAGAAIVLQAMARATPQQRPLTPQQIRKALSDRTLNTVCPAQPRIGTMPNLANLVAPLNAGTLHAFDPGPPPPWPPPA